MLFGMSYKTMALVVVLGIVSQVIVNRVAPIKSIVQG